MGLFMLVVLILTGIGFVLCLWIMARPEFFIVGIRRWFEGRSRYGIALFRLVFGLALFLAAPESKQPLVFQIFGALGCIKGLMVLFVSTDKVVAYSEKFVSSPRQLRAWSLVGIGICIYIVYLTPVIASLI